MLRSLANSDSFQICFRPLVNGDQQRDVVKGPVKTYYDTQKTSIPVSMRKLFISKSTRVNLNLMCS